LKFGQPRVMALFLALTLFHHLIDGFHNRNLRTLVVDLLGVTAAEYTPSQMTYDLRRLRLKGLIFRLPKTNRYFLTPHGWKVARLFSRLDARVFAPPWLCSPATMPFSRIAGDDVVEDCRIALRQDHPFAPARGAANEIGVGGRFSVVLRDDPLRHSCHLSVGEKREIEISLLIAHE
jgi:hypothetical protein